MDFPEKERQAQDESHACGQDKCNELAWYRIVVQPKEKRKAEHDTRTRGSHCEKQVHDPGAAISDEQQRDGAADRPDEASKDGCERRQHDSPRCS